MEIDGRRGVRKKLLRALAIAAILGPVILLVSFVGKPTEKDFISYWSAGQLFVRGGDPYSIPQVLALERAQGYRGDKPLVMLNPPSALFLALPLGLGSPHLGAFLWTCAQVACILLSLRVLKVCEENRIFAYTFAPFCLCLAVGQSSPFLLLGFALFLRFHRSRPWAAGAALALMAIKPILFLPFWPIVFIDSAVRRNYRVLAAGASAVGAAAILPMLHDPGIWSQYFAMAHAVHLETLFQPVPATLLRLLIAPHMSWVQLLPACAAVVWALWLYQQRRGDWCWQTDGLLLLLVTVLTAPYSWLTDEIVLLPAIMAAVANPAKPRFSVPILAAINAAVFLLFVTGVELTSGTYMWTSTAWLAWYLYSRSREVGAPTAVPRTRHSDAIA